MLLSIVLRSTKKSVKTKNKTLLLPNSRLIASVSAKTTLFLLLLLLISSYIEKLENTTILYRAIEIEELYLVLIELT